MEYGISFETKTAFVSERLTNKLDTKAKEKEVTMSQDLKAKSIQKQLLLQEEQQTHLELLLKETQTDLSVVKKIIHGLKGGSK